MEKYDVKFKKKLGQNFLKDVNIVKNIVKCASIDSNKSLTIEVGPGGAIMTKELAKVSKNVLAYEIDKDLENELSKRLEDFNNVDVIFNDFLDCDLCKDISKYEYEKLYFVSNVPYYITTPIIMKLLYSGIKFNKIVMMVQKEVGDRFSSKPGSKQYGAISVFLNYFYNIKKEFNVSKNQFIPVPKVDSVVISFVEKKDKEEIKDFSIFEKLIKDSFQFKRKTIKNNLKEYNLDIVSSVLEKYGFDLSIRAENLDYYIFVDIANSLFNA